MKYFSTVIFLIFVVNLEVIQCVLLTKIKSVSKSFHLEINPFKSFSFLIENIPFGKFEFKHSIAKRDTGNVLTAINEIPVAPIEQKIPVQSVVIPDIVFAPPKPEGVLKAYSLMMPWRPEYLMAPNQEPAPVFEPAPKPPAPVVEPLPVITTVVEVTPKPIEIVPVVAEPVNVFVTSPSKSLIPPSPPPPVPVFLTEKEPKITPLHTDITKIPLYSITPAYPATPVPILQEFIVVPATTLLPPPLPPPHKEEPPAVLPPPPVELPPPPKEEHPNYLIKGSRLMLFFGTKLLHMLSKFIEGGVNQIAMSSSFTMIEK